MDRTAFLLACRDVMGEERQRQGIGTLGEKAQHAVLKRYFDPCADHHEVRAGRYVADVRNDTGFVEIQTRQLFRLRKKLAAFLREAPVTVVYPVPAVKWVVWLDRDGRASPRRKSPRHPGPWEILPELYPLKDLLCREGLRFCVLLLEAEDYRFRDGRGPEGKRRAARFERLPVDLLDEVWLEGPESYSQLIPPGLPEEFTAKEFARAGNLPRGKSSDAMNVLFSLGVVERTGKRGNAYLYRKRL